MQGADTSLLTIGQVADRIGVQSWRLNQMIRRGLVPEPTRVGRTRVFRTSQVEAIRDAAMKNGYFRAATASA